MRNEVRRSSLEGTSSFSDGNEDLVRSKKGGRLLMLLVVILVLEDVCAWEEVERSWEKVGIDAGGC